MNKFLALVFSAGLGVVGGAAFAQSAPAASAVPASPPTPVSDDALYRQFGGQPGLVRLMDDFVNRLIADPRTNPFFKDLDPTHVKDTLVVQFCQLSGGPCVRSGPSMKKAHAGVDIRRSHFNALVEVLQQAMDAQDIPFSVQNRMLALLAPMHRDIVNVH